MKCLLHFVLSVYTDVLYLLSKLVSKLRNTKNVNIIGAIEI